MGMLDHNKSLTDYEKPLIDDPQTSYTLPSYLYTDPAVYEIEKERIFYRSWQYIAHKSLFNEPGDYITMRICDQNVFVILGDDDELRGFYNVCQHRAHELLPEGSGNVARAIVCPYHAWTFSKNGALRGAPRSEHRPGFDKSDFSLKSIRVEVFLDTVFVNLDLEAVALAVCAADLEADIRARVQFYGRLNKPIENGFGETRINAGWKVVVDNYVECYHCEHAHPAFADVICMDSYQHDTFGLWARQLGEEIRLENSAYKVEEDAPFMQSAFWFLWPNTTINILPGSEELNFASIRPTGVETCAFEGHTLTTGGEVSEERATYTADVLVPEDIALCESVQRGLHSKGYSQGPMIVDADRSGRGEQAIHHFHRLVQKALE
ncbi:MAG: phenylpropionate dioxygenase-like ring-hydroxylating dioxygenase large terminal subunit [Paracoccaceae bacterium]|jgi:phenylpropionate dioxygenase-like ring-hydroxylating dioxygenase large terminal subunit